MQYGGENPKMMYRMYTNLFCVGLVLGIFMLNVGNKYFLERTGLLDEDTLYQMKYMTVNHAELFWYIFRKRILRVLLLIVISTTYLGLVVCRGTMVWYGCSAGIFLATLLARYGLKGILLAVVSVLPQYILYVPVGFLLLRWCEIFFRGIYCKGGESIVEDKKTAMARAGKALLIIIAIAVGCLLESYVNPYLLLGFLKSF